MRVNLVTFNEQKQRKDFPLKEGKTVIGRSTMSDMRLPFGDVSRTHCELSLSGNEVLIRDLDSRNGTYVNGAMVREHKVEPGDRITVGPVVFTVQIDGEPTQIVPPSPAPAAKPPASRSSSTAATAGAAAADASDMDDMSDLDIDAIEELGEGELEEIEELDESDLEIEENSK